MRLQLAALVILALPAVALAQSSPPAAGVGTLPPIGLPLPPIGLPLPPLGLAPPADTTPVVNDGQPSPGQNNQSPRSGAAVVYVVPTFGWGYQYPQYPVQIAPPPRSVSVAPSEDRKPEAETGTLRLEVQPGGAQLYVDGFYVGTPDDSNGELEVDAGVHQIEIRAPGFETVTFDVKIVAGRSITYRSELQRADEKPEPKPTAPVKPTTPKVTPPHLTPATPATFYFIPGCYAGNVPPKNVTLPANCDLSLLVTRTPRAETRKD